MWLPSPLRFYNNLTVHEHLMYQARLRLPHGTTDREREQRVNEVIAELGLEKACAYCD